MEHTFNLNCNATCRKYQQQIQMQKCEPSQQTFRELDLLNGTFFIQQIEYIRDK